jgi:hypothetical protein
MCGTQCSSDLSNAQCCTQCNNIVIWPITRCMDLVEYNVFDHLGNCIIMLVCIYIRYYMFIDACVYVFGTVCVNNNIISNTGKRNW